MSWWRRASTPNATIASSWARVASESTLVNTLVAGPPTGDGGHAGHGAGSGQYWPTVGTRRSQAMVNTPGLQPLHLDVWDTSGNVRFKPLSLVFYRQAQSVLLVFDVKSRASFHALGEVGGWMNEFTRLTGASPRNFPSFWSATRPRTT